MGFAGSSAFLGRLEGKEWKVMLSGTDRIMLLGHGARFEFARHCVSLLEAYYGNGRYSDIIPCCSLTAWTLPEGVTCAAPRVDPSSAEFDAVRKLFEGRR